MSPYTACELNSEIRKTDIDASTQESEDQTMACQLTTLKNQRTNLQAAIRSGVQSMSVDGQTTTFTSMRDMRAVLADIESQIAQLEGSDNRKPRVSSITLTRGV